MAYDLILRNGTLVTSKETYKSDIGVKNGKIAFIGKIQSDTNNNSTNIDMSGLYILPGIIDAHVHFREPGLTHKEDFITGSMAAAAGGITFIADMPNTIPPTFSVNEFNKKYNLAREKSCIDFGLFALLTNDNTDEIPGLVKAGAFGFKVFLGTSTGNLLPPSPAVLTEQLRICTSFGKRTGFHAETSEINEADTEKLKKLEHSPPYGKILNDARPIQSEILAIKKAVDFAREANAMIHIHHVTCKEGVEIISNAKKEGINVTAETCPHYLFLNAENSSYKCYPPIRREEHRAALWQAVKHGDIDMIATDHAPHTLEEKSLSLWEAPAGLAGVETLVNLMLNEVNKGTITLNDFVRLCSEQPAKIWGIKNKGELSVASDADFTIVNMNKKVKINYLEMKSKSKTTPYNGWELKGSSVATIVRGNFISYN
ncbi:MAG: allantoinase AllB [Treponema sp.]|jgi:dihydroorotase|nr:allantoinase AllB [Treponema sp.]